MKILFVENRYKTYLWEIVGEEYLKLGHEVHFIVQNHRFTPKNVKFKVHKLDYPSANKENVTAEEAEKYKKVIASNRGLNYFGIQNNGFIAQYGDVIEDIVAKVNPDLVFGESTLFHELLIIEACKKRDILYLHPSSSRYPKNRFAFYKYDTLEPYKGSGERLELQEARKLAYLIGERKDLPDYMDVSREVPSKMELIMDKINLIRGYYKGERFNTPSPFYKKSLGSKIDKIIGRYEQLAHRELPSNQGLKVMYAMQMQPEANIDVWGYPFSNQAKVLKKIVGGLGENDILIIKPNPKSKYEIDEQIIDLIETSTSKICALSHSIGMDLIWDKIDAVVTVTGTVSIECVLNNKPVLMFGWGIQSKQKNCIQVKDQDDIKLALEQIRTASFPVLSEDEKVEFVNELLSTSYMGINGDGLHNLSYLKNEQNWKLLMKAYKEILH